MSSKQERQKNKDKNISFEIYERGGEVDQAKGGKPVVYLRRKAGVVTGTTLQTRPPGYSGKKALALREWHQHIQGSSSIKLKKG